MILINIFLDSCSNSSLSTEKCLEQGNMKWSTNKITYHNIEVDVREDVALLVTGVTLDAHMILKREVRQGDVVVANRVKSRIVVDSFIPYTLSTRG